MTSIPRFVVVLLAILAAGCASSEPTPTDTQRQVAETPTAEQESADDRKSAAAVSATGDSTTAGGPIAPERFARHAPKKLLGHFVQDTLSADYRKGVSRAWVSYTSEQDAGKELVVEMVNATAPAARYRGGIRFSRPKGDEQSTCSEATRKSYSDYLVFKCAKEYSASSVERKLVVFVRADITVQVSSFDVPEDSLFAVVEAIDLGALADESNKTGSVSADDIAAETIDVDDFFPDTLQTFELIQMKSFVESGVPAASATYQTDETTIELGVVGAIHQNLSGAMIAGLEMGRDENAPFERKQHNGHTVYAGTSRGTTSLLVFLSGYSQMVRLSSKGASLGTLYGALDELPLDTLAKYAPSLGDRQTFRATVADTNLAVSHPADWLLAKLPRSIFHLPRSVLLATHNPLAPDQLFSDEPMSLKDNAFMIAAVVGEGGQSELMELFNQTNFSEELPLENVHMRGEPTAHQWGDRNAVIASFEGRDADGAGVTAKQILVEDDNTLIHIQYCYRTDGAKPDEKTLVEMAKTVHVL